MRSRFVRRAVAAGAFAALLAVAASASAFEVAAGEREMSAIEARWTQLTQAPKRDVAAFDSSVQPLARLPGVVIWANSVSPPPTPSYAVLLPGLSRVKKPN